MIDKQMDALLGAYYRASIDDDPRTVTIEDLERMYPRIDPTRLASIGASLERAGYIEAVPGGGHVITRSGRDAYVAD